MVKRDNKSNKETNNCSGNDSDSNCKSSSSLSPISSYTESSTSNPSSNIKNKKHSKNMTNRKPIIKKDLIITDEVLTAKKINKKVETKPEANTQTKGKITKDKKKTTASNDTIDTTDSKASNFKSPMLASNYDGSQEISNWFMSEKLDGVRCVWDGKNLYSRNGNKFYAPDFFIEHFPKDMVLDGELFMNRNRFQEIISIVKRQDKNDEWKKIRYVIFDGPNISGNFKTRLEVLENKLKKCPSSYLMLHKHEICKGTKHLEEIMKKIVSVKGEGVILRDPNSPYENRRTKTMLKVKEFHDAEAIIIGINLGTGKYSKVINLV